MIFSKITLKCSKYVSHIIQIQSRSFKKQNFEMNIAYFRHVEGEKDFHVSMQYNNTDVSVNKQLNFCRQMDEPVANFLRRINTNLEKLLEKKNKKKKKDKNPENVESPDRKVESKIMRDGSVLDDNFPCSNIFCGEANYSLQILGLQLPVIINVPWIETMTLPKQIMAGFLVYPNKFESFFVDKEICEWTWFRSVHSDRGWIECGQGALYETVNEDVGQYLRVVCLPKNKRDDRMGPPVEAVSGAVVEAGPGPLPFVARHTQTVTTVGDSGFRVVSYNILADLYVDSEYSRTVLLGYCPAYALALPYRRQLLIKEILGYNADILALQEVDTKVFHHDLLPLLTDTKKMSGCFSQKGTVVNEGTVIFFTESKFKLVKNWSILLSDMVQKDPLFGGLLSDIKKNEAFFERVNGRSTTLQVCLLECLKRPGHFLLVANVHLYFHPDADHVRLLQGGLIVIYLEDILKRERAANPDKTISLVWCGDFNSVPECGIYELLTTGFVSENNPDWKSNEAEAITGINLSHKLKLASACGTPPFTNYTVGFKACLDYIYYDTEKLKVSKIVAFPTEEELSTHLAIPSVVYPSDHLALISDLEFV